MNKTAFSVVGRTPNHITNPKDQAEIDFARGRDIGYNPFPIYSDYWQKYRDAYVDCQLKGMADQMAADEDRCKSDYADEYVSETPEGMKHDEPMEDLG